jgi:hypothetical protein
MNLFPALAEAGSQFAGYRFLRYTLQKTIRRVLIKRIGYVSLIGYAQDAYRPLSKGCPARPKYGLLT